MGSSLRSLAKRAWTAAAPNAAGALTASRARAHSQRLIRRWGLAEINERLSREVGSRVLSGPFTGLCLTSEAFQEHAGPFLLGTYESELHPWWNDLLNQSFDLIVDIGAKFGYYAVGLALKFPSAAVVAFDTDWWARRATRQLATANGVSNVTVSSRCDGRWLTNNVAGRALVVSDCEGYEGRLFCHTSADVLRATTLLVETHEQAVPGVTADLEAHFARTHSVRRVVSRATTSVPDGIRVRSLTLDELRRASAEVRPQQTWLLLTPR